MTESFDCEGYTKEENKMDEYILKTAAMEIVRRTSGDYAAAFAAIRKLPAADVAPVVYGRWIHYDGVVICSACGNAETSESYHCNYCGAKMDGGAEG